MKFFKRCRFDKLCTPYSTYQKINPNFDLIIDGICSSGCAITDQIRNSFNIYYSNDSNSTSSSHWNKISYLSSDFVSGMYK